MKKKIARFGIIAIIGVVAVAAIAAAFLPGAVKSNETCYEALMSFRSSGGQVDGAALNACTESVVADIEEAKDNVGNAVELDDATKDEVISILSDVQDFVQSAARDVRDGEIELGGFAVIGEGIYARLFAVYGTIKDNPAALEELEAAVQPIFEDFKNEGELRSLDGSYGIFEGELIDPDGNYGILEEDYGKRFGDFSLRRGIAEWDDEYVQAAKDVIAEIDGLDPSVAAELNSILDDASALLTEVQAAAEDEPFAFAEYITQFRELEKRIKAVVVDLDEETMFQIEAALFAPYQADEQRHERNSGGDGKGCGSYGHGYSFGN